MTVESATYISDLNINYPESNVSITGGDNHIRLTKTTLKNTFPNITGAITDTHTVINTNMATVTAATNANTASTLVKRDSSGNFSAGTITAALTGNVTGNASTATAATALETSRTISLSGDVTGSASFDGTANATITATVVDGAGSGLDADTVDGIQASSFLRSDTSDTTTGVLTVDNHLIVQNSGVSGQGDNNTHFNYNNTGVNYIRGTSTTVNGNCAFIDNISVADQIIHDGDTNTYMQFHAADQWRVVTGGTERLEVNSTAVTASNKFEGKGTIQYMDVTFYSSTDEDQTVSYSIPSGHHVVSVVVTSSGFDHNSIKNIKNTSCVVDRFNSEGNQNVTLRIFYTKE